VFRLWRGEAPLDVAFWNWAVIGGLLVNIATSIGFFLLMQAREPMAALLVGYGLSVPYNALAAIGVWRSAARYDGPPHLAGLARWITLLGMALLSVT
jgi:uncharacterized membrane protein